MNVNDKLAEAKAHLDRIRAKKPGAFVNKLVERAEARVAELERAKAAWDQIARARAAHANDFEIAWANAELLADKIQQAGGPRRLRVWGKKGKGTGVRLYWPADLGYVYVSWDGTADTITRGQQTLAISAMYPSWRKAWRDGKAAYLAELAARSGLDEDGDANRKTPWLR